MTSCYRVVITTMGKDFSKHVVVLVCNFVDALSKCWAQFQLDLHQRLTYRFVPTKFKVLVPCRVDIGHWGLCKVNLLTWIIIIYDSAAYLKPTDAKFREEQVLPLRRLFPLICSQLSYYEISNRAPRKPLYCMKAVRLFPCQFPQQDDETSCGIFMLQGIENIMRNKDQQWNWNKDTVPELRKDMAFKIFGCSIEED
ncbi:hypothetical protein Ddye_025661 [Dipteronia dyeriana]|uniref:Ubiquitin-like protease family profile domain-containing protein n=1 Tax=Dipteronia dyeriana TaxID=168575 RepID=A0AAD9TL96_9ROSI|nr:hypothetical protein Ddye_025661 [Dipteronia dyeriana]